MFEKKKVFVNRQKIVQKDSNDFKNYPALKHRRITFFQKIRFNLMNQGDINEKNC